VLSQVSSNQDAKGVDADNALFNAFHARQSPLLLRLLLVVSFWGLLALVAGCSRGWSRAGLNLLFLLYQVLEILELDFQQEYDWLCRFTLSQLKQSLQKQEQCLHLQERLHVFNLLQD